MNNKKNEESQISFEHLLLEAGRVSSPRSDSKDRSVVCVQGLGFVGAAMSTALARSTDSLGNQNFNVIGVDLPSPLGLSRIKAINTGCFPFATTDQKLVNEMAVAYETKNLIATSNPAAYSLANVVIVDINCDVVMDGTRYAAKMKPFVAGICEMAKWIQPDTLVIVETTVPPGTCEKIVAPEIEKIFKDRGFPRDTFMLAHSYERVMPGPGYFDSIVNYWRVFAGYTKQAGDACDVFLSKVINVKEFPLTRLKNTLASETAKVLENSYRANTIAFIDEWGRFAEQAGINLFEVIDAIRIRPTHSNIRQPGFGVGGYCLTKDPLLPGIAVRDLLKLSGLEFPLSENAVEINRRMPYVSLEKIERILGTLSNKKIMLMGISYRSDVADTRYSPAELFYQAAIGRGAEVILHDPLVKYWEEQNVEVMNVLPNLKVMNDIDAIVFSVAHSGYRNIKFTNWLCGLSTVVLDANQVLTEHQIHEIQALDCQLSVIGRGDI
ncbi:nucleotide sugar dehydrogenase [bacterium]|nr:nucleotide sugar dehydrogenase [bacterium]